MTGLSEAAAYIHGPALCAGLAGLGLFVGVLTGLFGVGGAFLITPLLNLLFGIDYQVAVASSLCYTIGAGTSATARHARLGNVEIKSMLILAGGGICGALLGADLNHTIAGALGKEQFTAVMDGIFIAVLLLTAWLIFRGRAEKQIRLSLLQRLPLPPHILLPSAGLEHVSLFGMCAAGLLIGSIGGLIGIGGGVLFMPLLIFAVGLRPHQAVGTSLGVVLFSSIAGTVKYAGHGKVNLWVALALLAGSTIGVQLGVSICQRLQATRLRRWFSLLVLLVAGILLVRLLAQCTT